MKKAAIPTYYLFSPVAFILLFIVCYGLFSLNLTYSGRPASVATFLYVALCMAMFSMGAGLGAIPLRKQSAASRRDLTARLVYGAVWPVFFISLTLYLLEHVIFVARYGSVPVLTSNFEELRFKFPINGYVHLVAMLGRHALVYIFACKLHNREPRKSYVFLMWMFALTIVLDLLQGNRGGLVLMLFTITVVASFRFSLFKQALLLGVLGSAFLGAAKTFREYALYGPASLSSVAREWKLGGDFVSVSLYHLYMTFAYNFSMLDRYVNAMKSGFYGGYFTIFQPILSVLPNEQYSMVDLQRDVLSVRFHGALTSTFLGLPYVDFSYFGCLIPLLIGYVSQFLYRRAVSDRSPEAVVLYAFHSVNMFLGIYTYMYGYFYVLLNYALIAVLLPGLCSLQGRGVARTT